MSNTVYHTIKAYNLRPATLESWLRAHFGDATIVVDVSGDYLVFYLPRQLEATEEQAILKLRKKA